MGSKNTHSRTSRSQFPNALSKLNSTDLTQKRKDLQTALAPLGRAHMAAEALLSQINALANSDLSCLATIEDPSGVRGLKALTGALKDVAQTMTALRQEVRDHVSSALSGASEALDQQTDDAHESNDPISEE